MYLKDLRNNKNIRDINVILIFIFFRKWMVFLVKILRKLKFRRR